MKRVFVLTVLSLIVFGAKAQDLKKIAIPKQNPVKTQSNTKQNKQTHQEYVDLGLPSGTLWKSSNEKGGFVSYDEAISKYGDKLPTLEQWEELKGMCSWTWTGKGYKVTGDNGNSITLPAAGYRYCSGNMNGVGSYGDYWSSAYKDSDDAWSLSFYSGGVGMYNNKRCHGFSVRLVQD